MEMDFANRGSGYHSRDPERPHSGRVFLCNCRGRDDADEGHRATWGADDSRHVVLLYRPADALLALAWRIRRDDGVQARRKSAFCVAVMAVLFVGASNVWQRCSKV